MMIGDSHFAQRWFSYNNDFEVTVTYFINALFSATRNYNIYSLELKPYNARTIDIIGINFMSRKAPKTPSFSLCGLRVFA
jgi:hypothetical protein